MEFEDFANMSTEELMEHAQASGLKTAKQVGMLASRAWDAIERENYAEASTIYMIISRATAGLANQTFAMANAKFSEDMGTDLPDST